MRGFTFGGWLILTAVIGITSEVAADPRLTNEEFQAKLGYQTGTITLPGGMATIRLPPSFRYLGEEGSRRLLVEGFEQSARIGG